MRLIEKKEAHPTRLRGTCRSCGSVFEADRDDPCLYGVYNLSFKENAFACCTECGGRVQFYYVKVLK